MLEDLEMYIYINYKFLSENIAFDCSDERDNILKETMILKRPRTGQFNRKFNRKFQ